MNPPAHLIRPCRAVFGATTCWSRLAGACLLLYLCMLASFATAGELRLQSQRSQYALGPSLHYLQDTSGTLTIEQLRHPPPGKPFDWKPLSAEVPNFGYSLSTYWFVTDVDHTEVLPEAWVLEVAYPLLDKVNVYFERDGKIFRYFHTGDYEPFANRPVDHRYFLFPLMLDKPGKTRIWMQVASTGTIQLPATLWRTSTFIEQDQRHSMLQAIYIGMMAVMLLYNLFIMFSIRERSYAFYVAYVLVFTTTLMTLHGFTYQFIWPNSVWWQDKSMAFLVAGSVLCVALFTEHFLTLRQHRPRLSKILAVLAAITGAVMLLSLFLPYSVMIRVAVLMALIIASFSFIAGLMVAVKGERSGWFFVAAWGSFLIGIALLTLNKYGVLPRTWLTEYSIQLGSIFEVIVLSYALADRINSEKRARFQAQQRALNEAQQRQQAESRMVYHSLHDRLTGIPNQVALQVAGTNLLADSSARGRSAAVMLVYLQNFQEINNTLGHQIGDGLLQIVVQRLQRLAALMPGALAIERGERGRSTFHCANVEGVSYALIAEIDSAESIFHHAEQLIHGLREPFRYLDMSLDIGALVGIALYPHHGDEFDSLLRYAQIAVEVAQNNENGVAIYSSSLNPYNSRRLTLMGDLRSALESDQLELHFQPKINMRTGMVVGAEGLLRWQHPSHGFVTPDQFIPLAEQTGLIKPLTRWVIERAVRELASWHRQGLEIGVSVNISARNLREGNFGEHLAQLMQRYGLAPEWLTLEVTETAMMEDRDAALRVLTNLHSSGVRIAVDDFGVGYSSLAYLAQLPISELKIDKSFIFEMERKGGEDVIVRTTINMAHDLRLQAVAEGVESEITYNRLRAFGCDLVQGYHVSRPLPPKVFLQWLDQGGWRVERTALRKAG